MLAVTSDQAAPEQIAIAGANINGTNTIATNYDLMKTEGTLTYFLATKVFYSESRNSVRADGNATASNHMLREAYG